MVCVTFWGCIYLFGVWIKYTYTCVWVCVTWKKWPTAIHGCTFHVCCLVGVRARTAFIYVWNVLLSSPHLFNEWFGFKTWICHHTKRWLQSSKGERERNHISIAIIVVIIKFGCILPHFCTCMHMYHVNILVYTPYRHMHNWVTQRSQPYVIYNHNPFTHSHTHTHSPLCVRNLFYTNLRICSIWFTFYCQFIRNGNENHRFYCALDIRISIRMYPYV